MFGMLRLAHFLGRRSSAYQAASVFLLLCLTSLALWSQTSSARIEGIVTDSTGAAIAGAKLTAVNIRTQVTATVESSKDGNYTFASLPPGLYNITAEASGFRKDVVANLELNVATTWTQNFKMEVGSVTESVTVEASEVKVQTSDAQISRVVNMKEIDTLPQLARNPLALINFTPGISGATPNDSFARVNGLRQGANNLKLDGIDVNDAVTSRLGLSLTAFNTDSIQEFRVITNSAKAEYGRNAGAQIEVVTRQGTNQLHGGVFDYLRNTALNANNFFNNSAGTARPRFIQNIYGGNVGTKILKDKWFVFFNYQGRQTISDTVRTRTVYTAEARQGLFRWRTTAGGPIQSFNIFQNDPRGLGFDPTVKADIAVTPLPNTFDVGDGLNTGGYRWNVPSGSDEDQYTLRSDYNLTNTHRLFFRYSWQHNSSLDALNNAESGFPGRPSGTQGGDRVGFGIGSDWTLTPTLILETRFGKQEAVTAFLRPDRGTGPARTYSANITDPISTLFGQGRVSPVYDLTTNATKLYGKHTIKGGFTFRNTLQTGYNDAGIYPTLTITTASGASVPTTIGPSGTAVISSADRTRFENMYNDLLGRISNISTTFYSDLQTFFPAGTSRVRNTRFYDYGWFIQDDWKIRPNLTLNVGLRWDAFTSPREINNLQGQLTPANLINAVSRIENLTVQRTSQWYSNDYNNFAPRFGFAWDPFGNGKTSIRGSYGIFYDRIIGSASNSLDGATPGFSQAVTTFPNQLGTSDVRISDNPALPTVPSAVATTLPANRSVATVAGFDPSLKTPYVHHISLTVQREIFPNTIIDVGYVGTRGVKLFNWLNINQPRIYGDFLTAFKELQAFQASGTPVSANNTLVRIYGTPAAAITGLGATNVQLGNAGTAADNLDSVTAAQGRYANAGVSNTYLRNFPQFQNVWLGGNFGRTNYDSLQVSFRRVAGSLRYTANYTFSKNIDNFSAEGNGFTTPIDNFNLALNRGRADNDRPHIFNFTAVYTLPFGKGQRFAANIPGWANQVIGGWELGALGVWQSGTPLTLTSGRRTAAANINTWVNYSGDRNLGSVMRQGNGVVFFTPEEIARFSFPGAGEVGNAGRNAFRGPRLFNADLTLKKAFLITENHRVTFRAEAYNAFNNVNFNNPGASLTTPTSFGRISSTSTEARILQLALRYDF